jgi:hypothetical protein
MSYRFADSLRAGSGRKLVNLVGFIIRIYHDAGSPERQIQGVICYTNGVSYKIYCSEFIIQVRYTIEIRRRISWLSE